MDAQLELKKSHTRSSTKRGDKNGKVLDEYLMNQDIQPTADGMVQTAPAAREKLPDIANQLNRYNTANI